MTDRAWDGELYAQLVVRRAQKETRDRERTEGASGNEGDVDTR